MMTTNVPDSLRYVIANAPSAVALLDDQFCYLAASSRWKNDFKLAGDFYGKCHPELFRISGKDWSHLCREALEGRPAKGERDKIIFPNGSSRWVTWELQPWLADNGEKAGVIIYMDLIVDQEEKDSHSRRMLALYEETNDVARIGAWEVDLLKNEIYWSSITKRIHGVAEDYVPNFTSGIDFFKEGEHRNKLVEAFVAAVEKGQGYDLELEMTTADGRDLWVRVKGQAESVNGTPVRIYGTFQDIQTQKLQEIQLANSEIKYRSIIENSTYACMQTIPGVAIIDANEAAVEMFGYTLRELRELRKFILIDPKDPDLRNFQEERDKSGKISAELTGVRKNGEEFPCQVSSTIYYDTLGDRVNSLMILDLSDSKKAEKQIRMSEEQFRGAFEYSAIGMALFEIGGRCKRANQSLCDMLGYTKDELTSLWFDDITYPEDLPRNIVLMNELIAGKRDSFHLEKRYLHKNGTPVWVLLGVSILREANGDPIHFISQIQDINDHKIAENLVSEERKLLRTLIDNLPINVYIKDLDSRKTMVNRSEIRHMEGLTEEEILGKNDFELYPAEWAERYLKEDRQVLESGIPLISKETADTREDGTIRYQLTSKLPLRNNANEIIGLLGISYDITQIKEAEKALAVSEEKYRKIFENTQDIYYRTDAYGIITEISPSVEKYYGYTRQNVIGNSAVDFYFYKEDKENISQALRQEHSVIDFEVKLKSKNSELLYASVNARLIIEDGMVVGSEGSIRDITLRKLQENELTSLNTELKALNIHREKLLSVIGHDLKNPVAASLKLAELALMDTAETTKEELLEYLSRMNSGLQNAHELLEDLLRWAKNQFDSQDFNPVLIGDVQLQVLTCLQRLKPMAETKNIELRQDVEEGLALFADRDMLDTIIRNLVSNALKFTAEGSVVVSASRQDKEVLFTVSDTGSGMSEEVLQQLFDKSIHYTTYGTAGEKGTGLGLELCRDFVEKHQGKLWVKSTVGKGSDFYFTIPLHK